jgi:hypothetical protein
MDFHLCSGEFEDAGGILKAGEDHRIARDKSHDAGLRVQAEQIGREIAVRHILAPQMFEHGIGQGVEFMDDGFGHGSVGLGLES